MKSFYHGQETPGGSLSYQAAELSGISTQSSQSSALNNIPRSVSDQDFVIHPPVPANTDLSHFNFTTMPAAEHAGGWVSPSLDFSSPHYDGATSTFSNHSLRDEGLYERTYMPHQQYDFSSHEMSFDETPRSWGGSVGHSPEEILEESALDGQEFDPSEDLRYTYRQDTPASLDRARSALSYSPIQNEEFGRCHGLSFDKPKAFSSITPGEPLEGIGDRARNKSAVDRDDQPMNGDEPYAKLIHRALMSAPNRSMVLQEIYQWFRKNTVKGSSDSKGWMNSIRHNLSMNAAFRKTERKVYDDDTKKSTEWVLEEFAIKEGVQSTTRYRSKGTSNKKRYGATTRSRQKHSQKGACLAGMKNVSRLHREEFPTPPPKRQRVESSSAVARRAHYPSHYAQSGRSHMGERQRSPLTPPQPDILSSDTALSGPFFTKVEQQYELPYGDMYSLSSVNGVLIDDSPVFGDPAIKEMHIFGPGNYQNDGLSRYDNNI